MLKKMFTGYNTYGKLTRNRRLVGHARVHGNPHESTGQGKRRFVVTTRTQEFETNDRRR